jgi:hypothetical protein
VRSGLAIRVTLKSVKAEVGRDRAVDLLLVSFLLLSTLLLGCVLSGTTCITLYILAEHQHVKGAEMNHV